MDFNSVLGVLGQHFVLLVGLSMVVILLVFVLTIGIISFVTYKETPVKDRLKALKHQDLGLGPRVSAVTELQEIALSFAEPLSKKLYSDNVAFQSQIKRQLTEAGLQDSDKAVWRLMASRIVSGIVTAGILFMGGLILGQNFIFAMIGLIAGLLIGSRLPEFMLGFQASSRRTEIRYTLPDILDMVVVCVEAGLGLDATIQRVADEAGAMAPDLAMEFRRTNRELNAGIPRQEAFSNLGSRTGVDELRSLCALIIQADKMGTSIAETLRIYADDVRTKRRQKAEEIAAKASIKMTFPLVLFIFPPLFIVLMGPMVINGMGTFFGGGMPSP